MEIKITLINSHFTLTEDRIVSIMESIPVAIKKLPYTTARNLYQLYGKNYFLLNSS